MKAFRYATIVFSMAMGASVFAQEPGAGSAAKPAESAKPAETAKPEEKEKTEAPKAAGNAKAEVKICKSVADRECQDPTDAIDAGAGTVVCWSKVSGLENGEIHHVWFKGDEQMGDVTLAIKGDPWRTWSKKTLSADMKGDWRVEVRDSSGAVLETAKFKVQ